MTWDVVTTHPRGHARARGARDVLRRFGGLPGLDVTRLVGILTERDPLKAMSLLMPEPPLRRRTLFLVRVSVHRDHSDRSIAITRIGGS
jgi:CBS domain-containing protein